MIAICFYAGMSVKKPFIEVLKKEKTDRIPFWLMRQAGRYLPEYLELRQKAGSFLNLVYNPELASDVTVQPLRRFGMDAAILFSDILVVPHALGQDVRFEAGEGPRLDAITGSDDFKKLNLDKLDERAKPVFETVALTAQRMKDEGFVNTALIGFCGSPWTVICYMVEGGASKDFSRVRHWALSDPASFQTLVDIVTDASCAYLAGQVNAGAEVIQLFESWAGVLDESEFAKWVIAPTKKITAFLNKEFPGLPVIGFPRGAGTLIPGYVQKTGVDCVGLDQMVSLAWARDVLQPKITVQGNLDPVRLLTGGRALEDGIDNILSTLGTSPFIFNLGHGVIKETPITHVEYLAKRIKDARRT